MVLLAPLELDETTRLIGLNEIIWIKWKKREDIHYNNPTPMATLLRLNCCKLVKYLNVKFNLPFLKKERCFGTVPIRTLITLWWSILLGPPQIKASPESN